MMRLVLRNMKTGEYCSNSFGWTRKFDEAKTFEGNEDVSNEPIKYLSYEKEKFRIEYNEKHGKWKYVPLSDSREILRRVK